MLKHLQAVGRNRFNAWSPDGSGISFDADYDGDGYAEIYTLDVASLAVTRLTSNAANDQFADWSPDGIQMAFTSDRNGNWDIFVMQSDGNQQRALTDSPDWELFPAWSPDGSAIAFQSQFDNNFEINVMVPDGSTQRPLNPTPDDELWPPWGPTLAPDAHLRLEMRSQDLGLRKTFQAALGDLDGDGDLDIAFANPMHNPATI
ncbi:MAG: DPP IV N-terminal domain-containing protein [Anaerolineae bacterium]|jgi:Tol biopolymer transport system component|nr:DPP IV N-terminal domain-containing protein [Anaerolineae bacterium]